jgi:hypothetical protein
MAIVSLPRRKVREHEDTNPQHATSPDWVDVAAGGTLLLGSLLLLTNRRRAGMVLGVAGAALTLLTHQEEVRDWWEQIPTYVEQVQNMIGRAQCAMEEINITRENLQTTLTGTGR